MTEKMYLLKQMLSDNGVDNNVFSAHSTRAACSISIELWRDCPVEVILKKVDARTFAKFYEFKKSTYQCLLVLI